jgi:hypothetical protein
MRISKFFAAILFLFLISKASLAAVPEYAKPINAYQKKYNMSFSIWKPIGLQPKWYATYDGYPVTEIADNQWVYGVVGSVGQLNESIITVGSVDPKTVYILTPLPPFLNESSFAEKVKVADSLKDIFKTKCDNFGIAYTKTSLTPIAWESGTSRVYIWGGKKWNPVFHHPEEKMSDAIKRASRTTANMLKNNKISWTQIDTLEFTNYVKSAGYAWINNFETNMPSEFTDMSAKTGGNGSYAGKSSGGEVGNIGGGGGWDTGK